MAETPKLGPNIFPQDYVDKVLVENNDPWSHRSKGMRCRSCMWFVDKVSPMVQAQTHVIGRCRRHAPTMNGFPVVYSDDWCGDHKIDETK